MKRLFCYFAALLACVLACLVFTSCSTNSTGASAGSMVSNNQKGGHLIIRRSANFGTDLFLKVSVDGTEVGEIRRGQSYDGHLTPGAHVISVVVGPNGTMSAKKSVTVVQGQTYYFYCPTKGRRCAFA